MSSSQVETNKAIIRRLIDAHNRQDAAGAAGFFAPAATNHGRVEGSRGMEHVYRDLYVTFPDYHWEIQALFGEDDWVAVYITQTGTHLGTPKLPVFGGLIHDVAPTEKSISVSNIHIYQLRDGLVIKHLAVRDDLGMMQQMGLLPKTKHAVGDMSRPAVQAKS